MGKQQIALVVTFTAQYMGEDEELLDVADSLVAEETVSLIIPQMEDKFVVLPKVLEGVTSAVISEHQKKIGDFRTKKREEEKKRQERESMLFEMPASNGTHG